jgi:lipopolysaccharide/colanic/teichoic acid biosynthesis glycosyltransferase
MWSWPGTDAVIADEHWAERHWRLARGPLTSAAAHRVAVMSLSSFYERILGKVPLEHAARTGWVMDSVYMKLGGWYLPAKRVIAFGLAIVLLAGLSPLIALTMALVRIVDGPPVLFGQRRVGRMGREFVMWKIRTMRLGSESAGPFVRARDREGMATPLGRWLRRLRLDELPQLWNVVKGEMSLVGPRPEMSSEVAVLERKIPHYGIRHLLRPGITGWAQLNFKATDNPRDSQEKFRYDLYYLKNLSLDLDLTILLRTLRRVFLSDSEVPAASSGHMRLSRRGRRTARAMGSLGGRRTDKR